jgi:hypothetical protein
LRPALKFVHNFVISKLTTSLLRNRVASRVNPATHEGSKKMNIRIMLDFTSADEAINALQRIGNVQANAVIHPLDNPEAGANVMAVRQGSTFVAVPLPPAATIAPTAPSTSLLADVGFGQGVTLPAGAIPIPAPASAVAGQSAIAPVAPSGIPAAPPAPTAHAQQPAAAAPAPQVPAAPPTSAPGVVLDKAGLPWDARIHSSTKATIKDGTWRQKRDLDPAIKVAVEAELRAALGANLAATLATATAPAAPPPSIPAQAPASASGVSPSEPAAVEWTFALLMERLTPRMMDGSVLPAQVTAALAKHGLTAVGQLALAPAVVPQIAADLGVTP